jgi:catechol 2,3-dioxygenase-like lactoylglutathione lyase family enzyme
MIRQIDHLVIYVRDLEQAIRDYGALGFSVFAGGDHPGGATHNALVVFADGAYLELIAFKQAAPEHPWWHKAQRSGEGLLDYALLPSAIEQDVMQARRRGLRIEGPNQGGRTRPDGVEIVWQTARSTPDLPFLCGDHTPRALRVPEGDVRQHPNGALGVANVAIAVADLEASVARYRKLLGDELAVNMTDHVEAGVRMAVFTLGSSFITLAATGKTQHGSASTLRDHLATRGEGPFAVALRVAPEAATGALDPTFAHGALVDLVAGAGEPQDALAALQNG